MRQIIEPQIKSREEEVKEILFHFVEGNLDQATDLQTVEDLVIEAENIKTEISNFQNTLSVNPALSAVIRPQLDIRIKRRDELLSVISLKQNSEFKKISSEKMEEAKGLLNQKISDLEESMAANAHKKSELIGQVKMVQEQMDEVDFERTSKNQLLARYEGQTETQLIETNDTLRLIYKGSDKTFVGGN